MKMQLYERSAGDVVLVIGLWNVVATFTYGSDQKVELIRTNKASVYMDSITLPSSDAQGVVSERLKKFFGERTEETLLRFVGVVEPKMDKNNDAQWHTMAVVARFPENSPSNQPKYTESLMIIERTSL